MNREDWLREQVNMSRINVDDIPDIDLYMDQITTFMETHLSQTKRYEEDKIMTKTMINNYAKNHLIPSPVKKKYSKNHLILLIVIYYFKNILNLTDIQTIIEPLTTTYFEKGNGEETDLESIYTRIMTSIESQEDRIANEIIDTCQTASNLFEDCDDDYLEDLSLICHLASDIYIRKQLLEKLIDQRKAKLIKAEEQAKKKKNK